MAEEIKFINNPPAPRGYKKVGNNLVCMLCGSVVELVKTHDQWHKRVGK